MGDVMMTFIKQTELENLAKENGEGFVCGLINSAGSKGGWIPGQGLHIDKEVYEKALKEKTVKGSFDRTKYEGLIKTSSKKIEESTSTTKTNGCSGCKRRQAALNKAVPHLGDAVAVVAEPIAKVINKVFGTSSLSK